ncbi:dephospho-CoA kinase [Corynebacterium humireducens NBRC 106098 = DSM 45392]|uniref:Dephospho-CoA kinase n=1 Tax=Corynebacterium humireducens NBRC 106098 = DSM 45392 TaxID=1223515 RepID=A0A0B5DA39_9CORY|nr:dephospho-CoA kinase [Corynebacterium humireducens]AJE33058.1 dephospho-CoA kinase [Corynebacterium humireducens NBRC 106098 = DSM 45392]
MKIIGLTGGIGSGKTSVADLLRSHGLPVIDADQIARDIVEPGQPTLRELADAFGADIIREDGSLDRPELARRAFADKAGTQLLNSITHPRIMARRDELFDAARAAGEPAVIYDMPLLVEKGQHKDMDLTVVVHVDVDTRVDRLVTGRGLDEADVRRRIAAQTTDAARMAVADVIIDNNGPREELEAQVQALADRIRLL